MKTEVAILHQQYPAEIREHVVSRMQHLVRFFEGTVSLRAVLKKQHDEHCVELVASVRRGVVLVVDARAESITAALDEAMNRMGRVLSRHKGKLKGGRRKARP